MLHYPEEMDSKDRAAPRPRRPQRWAPLIALGGALLLAWALNQNVRVGREGPVDLAAFGRALEAARPTLQDWGLMTTSYNKTLGTYNLAFGPRLLTVRATDIEGIFLDLGQAWVRAGGRELQVYHYQTKRLLLRYSREQPRVVWERQR